MKNTPAVPNGPAPVRMTPRAVSAPRARVLEDLQRRGEAVTAAEVAASTGLHHNTAREHLDALVDLGLVVRERSTPHGRGRPSWRFRASEAKTEYDPRVREYAGLAAALSAYLAETSAHPTAEALVAGRQWGAQLSQGRTATDPADARRQVVAIIDELGFSPKTDADSVSVELTRCPLLDVAKRYPDVVCSVHLGLVQAALDNLGVDGASTELEPFARPGSCHLQLPQEAIKQ